ncbi:MAG: histidine phosphatase family protein [Myxococcaceae bacterium]|nr:histidine phosphatase family protein [Myxococcaceae bacterium]MCI0673956.1 histidine phosphatase family protein [Myxococcaceae bacterium]
MRIFLVRHSDADAEIPEGLGDEARTLTAKARATALAHFSSLGERVGTVQLVLTSPLARAVQTAQLFAIAQRHEGPLKAHRCLLPDMPVGTLEVLLNEHVGQDLVLVGHQPSMGAMASHLLGMQSFPKPVNPGTVIALERSDEGIVVDPSVTPAPIPARLLFYAAPGQPVFESL